MMDHDQMMKCTQHPHLHVRGFTLVETLIVIVLSGIIAGIVGLFLSQPIQGFVAQSRRALLVDGADTALRRIARDIHSAVPNSIRINASGQRLELLHSVDGGRYRASPDATGAGDPLDFTGADTRFDMIGQLQNIPAIDTTGAGNCIDTTDRDCLVIYNLGQTGADAWNGDNLATLTSVANNAADDAVSARIGFSGTFPFASPRQRFQIIDTPVAYACSPGAGGTGSIVRYDNYPISGTYTADLVPGILIDHVSSCLFQYNAPTATRGGLLTLMISIQSQGESIRMFHEVHVDNLP